KAPFIILKNYREHIYLRPKEVLYLKGDNNTTEIYLKNGEVVHFYKTLKTVQTILPEMFVRIQKSFVINTQHLYHFDTGKKICKLRGVSLPFPISKKYIPHVSLLEQKLLQVEK
ncbi:MAG TPA: LytTR family DNA-binding domain-containing protein, partial [Chitinophagaceae bacterium]|nr:LytTR family DNA-binding domain-containing protein [Chitinophagaceae bacterium]